MANGEEDEAAGKGVVDHLSGILTKVGAVSGSLHPRSMSVRLHSTEALLGPV